MLEVVKQYQIQVRQLIRQLISTFLSSHKIHSLLISETVNKHQISTNISTFNINFWTFLGVVVLARSCGIRLKAIDLGKCDITDNGLQIHIF
jgi:hypothetical protein